MGRFRTQLLEFRQANLAQLFELLTAQEIDDIFSVGDVLDLEQCKITENEFEILAEYVYNMILETEYYPNEIISAIRIGFITRDISLADLVENSKKAKEFIYNCLAYNV